MEQKPQVEQNTVENSAQDPALEYVEMTQSTEVSEQQLAMLEAGEEKTKDSLEIVEEQDVEKEPESKEDVAEESPPLEEAVAQEIIPASVAEEAPVVVEAAKEDTSSESEADDGGISASTWLWGIAGAGALAYALDSDSPPPEAPGVSLATDTGVAGDGLTNEAVFNVTGLEQNATWEYSTDGGNTWTTGSGSSFTVTGEGSYNVVVRQQTAKVSENSATVSVTIDTTSPEAAAMAVDRTAVTITITFDNAVNTSEVPAATEFHVEQNGSMVEISNVAFVDGALVVTVAALTSDALQFAYTGNSLQDTAGNKVGAFQQVVVSDGYIEGGQVYLDANNDGIPDASELLEGVTSDNLGQTFLTGDAATGNIIVTGGVNTDTGTVNTLVLKAPAGYTTVNPLTTLVQAVLDASETTLSAAEAEAIVLGATGLVLPEGETLASYDPQADASATGLDAQKVVAQIAVILEAAVEVAATGEEAIVQDQVVTNFAELLIANPTGVELTEAQLTVVYTAGDGTVLVSTEASTEVLTSVAAIDDATTLEEVITQQAKVTDTIAPVGATAIDLDAASDTGAADNLTADNTPTVNVTLGNGDGAGTDIVAGDSIVLYSGATMVASHVLTQAEVDSGSASITASALADGVASLTVKVMDRAGNMSAASTAEAVTIDTTAPAITSADPVNAIENAAIGTTVYMATATDANSAEGITYSLKAGSDAALAIDASTGAVTLLASPDHETATSHAFTVVATDAAGNSSEKSLVLNINDLDEVAPTITSAKTVAAVDENTAIGTVIYTAMSDDSADISGGVTYSLKEGSDAALNIDATTGEVTLLASPDHETATSHAFTVVATDAAGNSTEQALTLAINDLDEVAPTITSAASGSVDENTAIGTVVYTAASDDSADISGGVTYALKAGSDAALTIDAASGEVTLLASPDHETATSHVFTVVATDAAGNVSEKEVTLSVNDLDEIAPTITSADTVSNVNENIATGTVVYTATSDDSADISGGVTYSLKAGSDAALSINATSGEVTLVASPDHETATSHAFTVVATDAAGNSSEKSLVLNINDLDDSAPTVTSGAVATAIDENSGAGQVIYTATATDDGDISDGFSFSLKAGASSDLSIDAQTGEVTLAVNPDQDTVPTYAFTVVVTDVAGNATEKDVSLTIGDLDDTAPTITSGSTVAVDENTAAGQTLYTAVADDTADVSDGVVFSLKAGSDAALTIDASSGAVTSSASLDHETQDSYSLTVVATDAAGNSTEQAVILSVTDLNEAPTKVGSLSDLLFVTGIANQLDITGAFADVDAGDSLTYSLASGTLPTGISLSATGVISGTAAADSAQASYTIRATDSGGLFVDQTINIKAVSAPVVESIIVGDSQAPSDAAKLGDVITVELVMSEAFVLDTTGGTPTIGVLFGDSITEVVGTYALTSGNNLAFTLTAPGGDATSVSLASITLNGASLVGSVSGQSWETSSVGQSANYQLDNTAPAFDSGATVTIDENTASGTVIYTAATTDASSVTYSLVTGSDSALSINSQTGAVTINEIADAESQSSYSFTVLATDAVGNSKEQSVTLNVTDLDEVAPTITSGATTSVDENIASGSTVYTATADDSADVSDGVSFSFKDGSDSALSIDAATGVVTITESPNADAKDSYTFTVVATDAAGNSNEKPVTLSINDLLDAPVITSSAVEDIDENADITLETYQTTVTIPSNETVTYSLKAGSDAGISIDAATGVMSFDTSPDHETKSAYQVTIVATDSSGQTGELTVDVTVNDIDDTAPTITSAVATKVAGYTPYIYEVTADDSADVSTGNLVYGLADGGDAALLDIDAATGEVTLKSGLTDSASKSSYSFTVTASDGLNTATTQAVTVDVTDSESPQGPGVLQAGGFELDTVDNGDGTYTINVYINPDIKSDFTSGIENFDLTFNYTVSDIEPLTPSSFSAFGTLILAAPEPGKLQIGVIAETGLDSNFNTVINAYDVNSTAPLLSVDITPIVTSNINISLTGVILNTADMPDTLIQYGEPQIVTGTNDPTAYVLLGGDTELTLGGGEDILVLDDETGDLIFVTDFTGGEDLIEFGPLLSSIGYTSVASPDAVTNNVAEFIFDSNGSLLSLIETNSSELDNTFGGSLITADGEIELFYDADPAAGSVNIQTAVINVGMAITDITQDDLSGFIA